MDNTLDAQMEHPSEDPYDTLLEEAGSPPEMTTPRPPTEKTGPGQKLRKFIRGVTVEPLLLLYQFAIVSQTTINSEYIVQVYDHEFGDNPSSNISSTTDSALSKGEILAATESADFMSAISLVSTLPPLFMVYFYGTISDHIGRKTVLMSPVIGLFAGLFVNMIIVYLGSDVDWFLLSTCLVYVSGGPLVMNTIAYAYICDIATLRNRTARMLYVKVAELAALALGQLLCGIMITYCGYFYAQMLMFLVSLLAVGYIVFFVRESRPSDHGKTAHDMCVLLKSLPRIICTRDGNYRRLRIFVYSYMVAINALYDSGGLIAMMMFLLDEPVGMSAESVSAYMVEFLLVRLVGTLIIICWQSGRHTDWLVVLIATLSAILGTAGLSVPCYNTIYLFIVPVFGMMSIAIDPVSRSAMSKLVSPDDQGAISAWASLVATPAFLIGATMLPYIFSVTYAVYAPAVFCVSTAIYITALALLCMLRVVVGRESVPYRETDLQFEDSPPASQSTPLKSDAPVSYGSEYYQGT